MRVSCLLHIVSDCMRKLFIISWLLLLSLCGTGCVRMTQRIVGADLPPPYRIYSGTKFAIVALYYMMKMEPDPDFSYSTSKFGKAFGITIFVVDLPLEFVMETILLPVDLVRYACYCCDPPLDKYLRSNDLKGLEKRLKEGISPNVISPWFMEKEPLLYQAYVNHNEDAFELLLKYGAKIPIELLQVEENLDEYTYRMLQRVFRDGCPKELQLLTEDELRTASSVESYRHEQLKGCFSYWILKYLMHQEQASPNDKLLVDIMVLLLENGFSPNDWEQMRGDLHYSSSNQYPLDVVMANMAMDTTEKKRLIAAMRKHGALTYRESNLLPQSESIPPMSQPD